MGNADKTSQRYVATGLVEMDMKRPGLVVVKKHVVKELCRDPYWREKIDNARSTAEAIQIIRDLGKAKGYSTDDRSGGIPLWNPAQDLQKTPVR